MSSPAAIRAALASVIEENVTLNGTIPALSVSTDPGSAAPIPCAVILPGQGQYIDYLIAQPPGCYDVTIRVVILVSKALERVSYPLVDAYLGTTGVSSVAAAILKDPTLGGVTDYCIPQYANGPAAITWNGVDYLGVEVICTAAADS